MLTAESLAEKLLCSGETFREVLAHFENPEDLDELLESDDFKNHEKLFTKFTFTRIRLQAIALLPQHFEQLQALTTCGKPEVARRCLMSSMNLAGISTQSATPPKTRAPEPDQPDDEEPGISENNFTEDQCREAIRQAAFNSRMESAKIDLYELSRGNEDALIRHLEKFAVDKAKVSAPPPSDPLLLQKSAPTAPNSDPHNINQTPVIPAPNQTRFGVPPSGGPPRSG